MRRYPVDSLKFTFSERKDEMLVEFWKVPKGAESGKFISTVPDYKLNDLTEPLELSTSTALDEFCPRHFDLEWYSHFLNANPRFVGRIVIDVRSTQVFRKRVRRYRKKLRGLNVPDGQIRYYRKHFNGERDAQFWLVPPKHLTLY